MPPNASQRDLSLRLFRSGAQAGALLVLLELILAAPVVGLGVSGRFVCCAGGPGCPLTADPTNCGGSPVTNVGFGTRNSITLTFDAAGGPVTGTAELYEFMLLMPSVYSIYTATLTGTYDPASFIFRGAARTHEYVRGYPGSPCESGCDFDHDDTWGATIEGGKLVGLISYGFSVFEAEIDLRTPTAMATVTATPTLTASPIPTATVDLVADRLEVVQSVQDLHNGVLPLVAGKRTFVRFHVHASEEGYGATATLNIRRGDKADAIVPNNPGGAIGVRKAPQRVRRDDSFFFELPDGFLQGTVALTGRLSPINLTQNEANDEVSTAVSFEDVPDMNLVIYRVGYARAGKTYFPAQFHVQRLRDWLTAAYPTAKLRSRLRSLFFRSKIFVGLSCAFVNAELAGARSMNRLFGREPASIRYYGMVDDRGEFMRGCGYATSATAVGPTG
ncbi:MAG TPA: hypothetical protein VL049_09790, partial [Candidatus Dormibacteraeota bacterium]|nr:hypothetical protein [Candidatus Dormibacteraeota bacterium]